MEIVRHADLGQFDRLARPLYAADPLHHTIALTGLDPLVREGRTAALALTLHEGGAVAGAVLRTGKGRPLLASGVPERHAPAVAEAVAAGDDPPAVTGPVVRAEAFAAAWAVCRPVRVLMGRRSRLLVLGALVPPVGVPGSARRAGSGNVDLLADWRVAFSAEALGEDPGAEPPREAIARSIAAGVGEWLWEAGGVPVAQASARVPVAGMCRIGPVYTPPDRRGHGYAAAVTAAASAWALDAGAGFVALFADVANPTTNRLYPRLGYRFHHDAVDLAFATPS